MFFITYGMFSEAVEKLRIISVLYLLSYNNNTLSW